MSEAETSAAGAAAPLVRAHSSSISSPRQTAKSVSGSSSSSRMRARSITGSNAQQHTGISGRVSSTGNLTALSSTAAAGTEAAGETQSYGRRSGASLLAGSPISRLKRSMTYSSANDEQLQAARAASAKARASPSSSREVPLTSPAASRSRSRAKSAVERVPTLSYDRATRTPPVTPGAASPRRARTPQAGLLAEDEIATFEDAYDPTRADSSPVQVVRPGYQNGGPKSKRSFVSLLIPTTPSAAASSIEREGYFDFGPPLPTPPPSEDPSETTTHSAAPSLEESPASSPEATHLERFPPQEAGWRTTTTYDPAGSLRRQTTTQEQPAPPARRPLSSFRRELAVLVSAFAISTFVLGLLLASLPPVPFPHDLSGLPAVVRALDSYARSSTRASLHIFIVVSCAFVWKQAFSVPGTILLNVLLGAMYGTFLGSMYACIWTAVGSMGAYALARTVARPLVEQYMQRPLELTRRAIIPAPGAANPTADLFTHLLLARFFPLVPYFVLNVIAGVLRVPVGLFFATLLLGSWPFNFVTVSVGEVVATIASNLSSGGNATDSSATLDSIWSPDVLRRLIFVTILSVVPVLFRRHIERGVRAAIPVVARGMALAREATGTGADEETARTSYAPTPAYVPLDDKRASSPPPPARSSETLIGARGRPRTTTTDSRGHARRTSAALYSWTTQMLASFNGTDPATQPHHQQQSSAWRRRLNKSLGGFVDLLASSSGGEVSHLGPEPAGIRRVPSRETLADREREAFELSSI